MKGTEKKDDYIDLDKVIKKRKSVVLQRMPRFVINHLKRIIHQDDLNEAIRRFGHTEGSEFVENGLKFMNFTYSVKGLENVPKQGKYVFASNHPLGGGDGLVFMSAVANNFGAFRIIANDILMNLKNLHPVFVGVNKHGATSKDVIRQFDAHFADNDLQIAVFPAGLISRRIKGRIVDLEWKKTFLKKAIQHKRDIVPVHITGRVSDFFYYLSNIRKKSGIKANIEMLFLVNETFKRKGEHFVVTLGKPVSFETFDKRFSHSEWAQKLKEHVYTLQNNTASAFNTEI